MARGQTESLSRSNYVQVSRNTGLPNGAAVKAVVHGNGVIVVVRERESRLHGEGSQEINTQENVMSSEMLSADKYLSMVNHLG